MLWQYNGNNELGLDGHYSETKQTIPVRYVTPSGCYDEECNVALQLDHPYTNYTMLEKSLNNSPPPYKHTPTLNRLENMFGYNQPKP